MTDEKKNFMASVEALRKAFKNMDAEYADMVEWCDHDMKLAVTKWVMKHIVEHAKEGGSYRYLIYDRLGFGPEAYAPLCSDGMTISNEFDLNTVPDARAALAAKDSEELKKVWSCSDEPGFYKQLSGGRPRENGYRSTCGDHYPNHQERKNAE